MIQTRYMILLDFALTLLSVAVAFALRFDTLSVGDYISQNWFFAPLLLAIRLPLFYLFGLYRRMWRYASVNELIAIVEACLLSSAIAAVAILIVLSSLGLIPGFPRSIILIEGMLALLLVGGVRFSFRLTPASVRPQVGHVGRRTGSKQRVVIFGAGDAGSMIVQELHRNPALGMEPVAFLDDDVSKRGLRLHNVPVLGDRLLLGDAVRSHNIDAAIIAMPTAPGGVIREITDACRKIDLTVKTIPGLYEILGGAVSVSAIREVQLEDLLRRQPVSIDLDEVGRYLGHARVLVTGAGGSIGSELCRQIARFDPASLVLFELSEHNLYQVHRELVLRYPALQITPVLGDVRDNLKVESVFAQHTPQVVFHAAAHKHVNMVELNADEALRNNVFGTRNVLEASLRHQVQRFVLISTDKAVDPQSIMGATKRLAELLVQDFARRSQGAFVSVRFGNVLGSSGSVVPLFKEQIAAGGPVTVTHPEVERYFMTIPEAVSLVIQAAAFGKGGEIFVLDMGEPVRIQDLARDLIRLSGLEPNVDIGIVFTGLKPGEKLSERLFMKQEHPQETPHPQIHVVHWDGHESAALAGELASLEECVRNDHVSQIKKRLSQILSEYIPQDDQM